MLKSILSSESISEIALQTFINLLENNKGSRSFFINSLYQDKFREFKYQILSEEAFDILLIIIIKVFSLYEDDDSNYEDIRLLTKSIFCYYK
jgi:hypothetical protein